SRLSRRHQERIASNEIKSLDNIIKTKRPTVDQVVYINNRVLIPRLEYRLCTILFSILTARRLYTPLTKIAKQLLQLPSSAHTSVLTHPGIVGFITLEQNQLIHHFTEFSIRINENTLATETTLARLRHFQLKHKITSPIWT